MSSVPKLRYTPEQYLEMERKAEFRHEYVNGEILAMAGASRAHNRITLNIGSALSGLLEGTPCEPYTTDMRVRVSPIRYTYPDVVVACDPAFEDREFDMLLNPIVIIEVLSPSTESNDRSWKFAHYRRLETLRDYVLISQERPSIEHYTRHDMDLWTLQEVNRLGETLRLPSIECELPLANIYNRVVFAPASLLPDAM